MDLLATILACSLYLEDDPLVRAIAESNSQSNPAFVLDASVDPTEVDPPPPPKSTEAAVARSNEITAKGDRPLLGLMQISPAWLEAFGRSLAEAFDPCENVAIGTAMLSSFDYACGLQSSAAKERPGVAPVHAGNHSRRACVVRRYAEAIGLPDLVTLTTLELRYQRPSHADLGAVPIFALPGERAWGPDRLFVAPSPTALLPAVPP